LRQTDNNLFRRNNKKLIDKGSIKKYLTIRGENPYELYQFEDSDVLIVQGQVGCPACAGNLDLLQNMGIKKVMFCGGGGVLDKNIAVGKILVVEGAIRDEGFSYHYLKPSRIVYCDQEVVKKITAYLDQRNIAYLTGLTWTTDAIFRETIDRINLRRSEGAKMVEMEQAGCIAVGLFRKFSYGALIYGGDDVSQDEWDRRSWRSREGIRYDLVMLCKELVGMI
jgi:uridine phosphorylase